jgi:hypothetical protein
MPGKEGLRAQRRSAGCNSDGAARARSRYRRWRATGRGRLSIDCAVMSREITTHDDAGRVGADHIVALALALRAAGDGGAGPMGRQHRSPSSEPAGSPYDARAGLLMSVTRNRIRFFEIAFVSSRSRQISSPTKRPLTAGSTGTYAEFVIAIANLDHCRYSALVCPTCSIGSSVAKYSISSRWVKM